MEFTSLSKKSQEISQDDSQNCTEFLSSGVDSSPIIPSMIPTQEVLENIDFYRGDGKVRLEGYDDEGDERGTECSDDSPVIQSTDGDITTPVHSTELFSTAQYSVPLSIPNETILEPDMKILKKHTTDQTPSGSPTILRTYSRKHPLPTTSPLRHMPKMAIEDLDPIIDFDDSEEEGNFDNEYNSNTNFSPSKVSIQPQTRKYTVPYESPSRKFILPTTAQSPNDKRNGSSLQSMRLVRDKPPDSPSKRLRPLSEMPRPIVSAHLHTQGSPSRKNKVTNPTDSSQIARPPQTTSKSAVSPRQLRPLSKAVPPIVRKDFTQGPIAIQPPPALGPQLMKIANAIRNGVDLDEDEDQTEEILIRKKHASAKSQAIPGRNFLASRYSVSTDGAADLIEPSERTKTSSARVEFELPAVMELYVKTLKSPFVVSDASKTLKTSNSMRIKKEELTTQALGVPEILPDELLPDLVQFDQQDQEEISEIPSEIPLPSLVLEYAPKLTFLDHIKWPPAKTGRFHILGLVIFIGPEEQVSTKTGSGTSKREITLCDHSATSFKLNLWGECCKWADSNFRIGDAVLITDIHTKEFRQKISGSTSSWSKVVKLDGSLLGVYRGHDTIEIYLKVFIEKRRCLGIDLLDKDKGIIRDPSLYLTHNTWSIPVEIPANVIIDKPANAAYYQTEGGDYQYKAVQTRKTLESRLLSATSSRKCGGNEKSLDTAPSSISPIARSETGPQTSRHSQTPSGVSIKACVVYKMLLTSNSEGQGWEIGVVLHNGRMVSIQCEDASSWINDVSPGRVLQFFGRFKESSDKFCIEASARVPSLLREGSWDSYTNIVKSRKFKSIKSLCEHKFMGEAILEGYILAIGFTDINFSDNDESTMFGFIRCYCTGCESVAVASPQNPSILFCRECELDPQKRELPLEWRYPPFELSLGDKPRMGANLTSESLQVRCMLEVGDQVFPSVPAKEWMQDEESFWESRKKWKKLVDLINNQSEGNESCTLIKSRDYTPRKVRVEVMVGVNRITKANKVEYI